MYGSKGALGFVAINNADNPWSTTFMTGLPGGSYCNVIDGKSVAGVCTGDAYVAPDMKKKKKETTDKRYVVCRFTIGSDGSLVVTVGVRQAIAVHVGALGIGTGAPLTAQQVPVLFYENANTTLGEVRAHSFFLKAWLAGSSLTPINRTFSSWEACRNSATGTHPTRCVSLISRIYADWLLIAHADTARCGLLPRVVCDGVLTSEYHVPVQVHPQRD